MDYLEMNIEPDEEEMTGRFHDSVERLTRLWIDERVELYCCSCFEPSTELNDDITDQSQSGNGKTPRIKIANIVLAFVLFMAATAIIGASVNYIAFVPLMVLGIIAGFVVGMIGMMLYSREIPR